MVKMTRKSVQKKPQRKRQTFKPLPKTKRLERSDKDNKYKSEISLGKRLERNFFSQPSSIVAQRLLGKILCKKEIESSSNNETKINSDILRARIVETEMYPGVSDPASHSYQGKRTSRNGAMFMEPGVCYVYNIYGMYQCVNISSLEPGGCVLLRALEPLQGIEKMKSRRLANKKKVCDKMKEKDYAVGHQNYARHWV